MGVADKQFSGVLRQAIQILRKALEAKTPEERRELTAGLPEDMQNTLED